MPDPTKTFFVSAAEASGDAHAARLIRALRALYPQSRFVGVGGAQMAAAGCEILEDPTRHASMIAGPLLKIGYYYRMVRRIQKAIREIRPDVVIPVDSPALNWHFAKAGKQVGSKVVYYIAPQVWAWASWRVKKIIRLTDHVACILPFEEAWLRKRGVAATYVGHPLFDELPPRPEVLPDLTDAWSSGRWKVALLAGSRSGEIHRHARALAEAASAIRARWPEAVCTFTPGTQTNADLIRKQLSAEQLEQVELVVGQTPQILAESHFAIAVSGTVTLEVAWYGVPMVIFYRVNRWAYNLIGRWLLKTKYLSLANIIAHREVVPELMPWYGSNRLLSGTVLEMMDDLGYLCETRNALLDTVNPLRIDAPHSASKNAAELVRSVLENKF